MRRLLILSILMVGCILEPVPIPADNTDPDPGLLGYWIDIEFGQRVKVEQYVELDTSLDTLSGRLLLDDYGQALDYKFYTDTLFVTFPFGSSAKFVRPLF